MWVNLLSKAGRSPKLKKPYNAIVIAVKRLKKEMENASRRPQVLVSEKI